MDISIFICNFANESIKNALNSVTKLQIKFGIN